MPQEPKGPAVFPATRWSLIGSMEGPLAEGALAELCRLYWLPLYTFSRHEGLNPEDAEDLTQEFFRKLVEEDAAWLRSADPGRGRLRTLLMRVLQRRIVDFRRHTMREKRGGGRLVALDIAGAEALLAAHPGASAEEEFDRHWAGTVLDLALQRLEADYQAVERRASFDVLRTFLGLDGETPDLTRVQEALGLSPNAARKAVSRFRERFRATLRLVIAETLGDPSEDAIDDELRALRTALQRSRGKK